jgi:cytochrome c peroxidase
MGAGRMGGGNQLAMLGRMIFCDRALSQPEGQSCAGCHSPDTGFTGPTSEVNAGSVVYPGAADTPGSRKFGDRKPPSAAYATPSPNLHLDAEEGIFVGGLFWDGRATGEGFASPAAQQALGPFTNPVEQAMADASAVVQKICSAPYNRMFTAQFGAGMCDPANAAVAYKKVGEAVAAFEASPMVNRYSSRYDRYLRGEATLTWLERKGLALFKGKGRCAECHPADPDGEGNPPLFTDNTFDNLGLPRTRNEVYDAKPADWFDPGLGGFLRSPAAVAAHPEWLELAAANEGKHRVPTLRNVDKRPAAGFVKAYGHNGFFKSLKSIVHFYNTRDVLPDCADVPNARLGQTCWPAPEVRANLNTEELGNLRLTAHEEDAIVAFLKTLSDG